MKPLLAAVFLVASTSLQAEYRAIESPFVTGMQAMIDAMREPTSRYDRYGRTEIISPFGGEGLPFERYFGDRETAPELRLAGRWRSPVSYTHLTLPTMQ